MPSRKFIKQVEQAFEVKDDWFEEGIGAVQARVSAGNQSNFPIGQEEIDNLN